MAVFTKTEIQLDHIFDPTISRHYMNGQVFVLHCHHYATLYSQLADDCGMMDGKQLLAECSEDSFYNMLVSYFEEHGIMDIGERISLAEQYYAVVGFGKMKVICAGQESGVVELEHSHVDEGWIKKWGKREEPVNFITCGYVAALFSAVFDKPIRTFSVKETESIVTGAERSRFVAVVQ
jgi:predicted hydrocarbon binding protein